MKKVLYFLTAVFVLSFLNGAAAQEKRNYEYGLVGFYNLENLFDTIDNPEKNDEEYLPDGKNAWGTMKYTHKIHNMAYAISKMHVKLEKQGIDLRVPDWLGVSEVECIGALEDLCNDPQLAPYGFKAVLVEGPDRRGVDVGFIYQESKFELMGVRSVPLTTIGYPTRDQLVVTGRYMGDVIHIIVNHWPSRLGGEAKSSPNREAAGRLTRSIVDSLLAIDPDAKVIVMGDLNDDPYNKSVTVELNAPKTDDYKTLQPGQMFNASYGAYKRGNGTLCYRSKWNLFDQIIISQGLLGSNPKSLRFHGYRIFSEPFLFQKSGPYAGNPLRTHAGGVWLDGYSDHLPALMVLRKAKN